MGPFPKMRRLLKWIFTKGKRFSDNLLRLPHPVNGCMVDNAAGRIPCNSFLGMIRLGHIGSDALGFPPYTCRDATRFRPDLEENAMTRRYVHVGFIFCAFVLALALRGQCADPPMLATEPIKPGFVPKVTIDAGKTREPISKYIYGQFIEHLGRCIYGGIWAEMLEDRKFFDPVGSPSSRPGKPSGRPIR